MDEPVESGRGRRIGEALVDVRRIGIGATVQKVLTQRARQENRFAARKRDAPRPLGRLHRRNLDAAEGKPTGRWESCPPTSAANTRAPLPSSPASATWAGKTIDRSMPEIRVPLAGS